MQILPSVKVKNRFQALSQNSHPGPQHGTEDSKPGPKDSPGTVEIQVKEGSNIEQNSRAPTHREPPVRKSNSQHATVDKNVLIITDSTGRNLNHRRLSRDQSFYVKKLSQGKDIADAKDYIGRTRITPKTVILNVGTNCLAREAATTTKTGLINLITVTRTKFSSAKILYSPILPRIGDNSFNKNAQTVNAGVKKYCDQA